MGRNKPIIPTRATCVSKLFRKKSRKQSNAIDNVGMDRAARGRRTLPLWPPLLFSSPSFFSPAARLFSHLPLHLNFPPSQVRAQENPRSIFKKSSSSQVKIVSSLLSQTAPGLLLVVFVIQRKKRKEKKRKRGNKTEKRNKKPNFLKRSLSHFCSSDSSSYLEGKPAAPGLLPRNVFRCFIAEEYPSEVLLERVVLGTPNIFFHCAQ